MFGVILAPKALPSSCVRAGGPDGEDGGAPPLRLWCRAPQVIDVPVPPGGFTKTEAPPVRIRLRCRVDLRIRMRTPPPPAFMRAGGAGRHVGGVHPPAHTAPCPPGRRCRQGDADGVRMREGGGACVQARGGCRRVQTMPTLSGRCGDVAGYGRSVPYASRCVFSFLHLTHKIKPESWGFPTILGLDWRIINNKQHNQKIEQNTMTPWSPWHHRGRVSLSPQGAQFPR